MDGIQYKLVQNDDYRKCMEDGGNYESHGNGSRTADQISLIVSSIRGGGDDVARERDSDDNASM